MKERRFSRREIINNSLKVLAASGLSLALPAFVSCGQDEDVEVVRQNEPRTENLSPTLLGQVARESAQEFSKAFGIEVNPEEIAASTKLTITPEEFKQAKSLFDTPYNPDPEVTTTFFIAEKRLNTPKRIYVNGADLENIFKEHTQDYPSAESKRDFLKGIMFIALADCLSAEYSSRDFSEVIFSYFIVKPKGQHVDELGQDVYVDGATLKFHQNGLYLSLLKSVEMAESLKIAKYLFDLDNRAAKIDFLNGFRISKQVFALHDELFGKLFPNYNFDQMLAELVRVRATEGEREKLFERVGHEFGGKRREYPAMFYGFLVFNSVSIGDVGRFRQRVAE